MLAIDTNVLIRYLIGDHPEQSAQARALIDGQHVFVCTTVLLESEWVLRGVYGLAKASVAQALRSFSGLSSVTIENAELAARALDWMEAGVDFADALHLTKTEGCDAFVSFDRSLVRAANRLDGVKAALP